MNGQPRGVRAAALAVAALAPAWSAHALDAERLDHMLEQGLYLEARELLQAEARDAAEDAELAFYRARVALKLGDPDAALEALAPYRARKELSARMHRLLGVAAGLKASRASMFGALGQIDNIERHFTAAIEGDPGDHRARIGLLQFYLKAPGLFGGSDREAREQALALAELDPALGLVARALIAADDDRLDEAIELARRAVEREPGLARARSILARLSVDRGRPKAALDALGALLDAAPRHPEYNYRFAGLAAEHGLRVERALEAARRYVDYADARAALGIDGDERATGYYRLGRLHERAGDAADARDAYAKALAIDPDHDAAEAALEAIPKGSQGTSGA